EGRSARKGLRVLAAPAWRPSAVEERRISGGVLVQTPDRVDAPGDDPTTWKLVAGPPADEAVLADLAFAWRACRSVKSNAILLASGGATVGIGMGQVNRVDAARLAVARAGAERSRGAVAASAALFPGPEGGEGVGAGGGCEVVRPGAALRAEEVIAAPEAAGFTLYGTGPRHFWH